MDQDPIAKAIIERAQARGLLKEGKAEYREPPYGNYKKAKLVEVTTYEATDFGYRLGMKFDLEGDETKFYTGRIDLPLTPHANGEPVPTYVTRRYEDRLNILNRAIAAIGENLVLNRGVDDADDYQDIMEIFSNAVGQNCPVQVKKDYKNIKDENAKRGWRKEETGFATLDFMRR